MIGQHWGCAQCKRLLTVEHFQRCLEISSLHLDIASGRIVVRDVDRVAVWRILADRHLGD